MSDRGATKTTLLIFAALTATGASRFITGKFSAQSFIEHPGENALFIAAGLVFGLLLGLSVDALLKKEPGARLKNLAYAGCAAAAVFLVVIHQTRNFISDGPPALAMGLAFLMTSLAAGKPAGNCRQDGGVTKKLRS
ncbi:MAG: hypothetical protein HZB29_14280 [Nitrospinae bacterium]|nr:hypothetical protein [Nitrospinota bacterium]